MSAETHLPTPRGRLPWRTPLVLVTLHGVYVTAIAFACPIGPGLEWYFVARLDLPVYSLAAPLVRSDPALGFGILGTVQWLVIGGLLGWLAGCSGRDTGAAVSAVDP